MQINPPVFLELKTSWNKYYRTVATPDAPEITVTGVFQQQKQKGSGQDTWLSFSHPGVDAGVDCKVIIQHLHPELNGEHQVDKFDPAGPFVAIRAAPFSQSVMLDIASTTSPINVMSSSRSTLKKTCQVDRSKTLHWVTVASFTATDSSGSIMEQSAFEALLRQAVHPNLPAVHTETQQQQQQQQHLPPHSFSIQAAMLPVTAASEHQVPTLPVLPSIVLHQGSQTHSHDSASQVMMLQLSAVAKVGQFAHLLQ